MVYQTAEQLEAGMARVHDTPSDEGPVRTVTVPAFAIGRTIRFHMS